MFYREPSPRFRLTNNSQRQSAIISERKGCEEGGQLRSGIPLNEVMLFCLLVSCLLLIDVASGVPGASRMTERSCADQCSENYTDQWAMLVSSKLVAVLAKNESLLSQIKSAKGDMCSARLSYAECLSKCSPSNDVQQIPMELMDTVCSDDTVLATDLGECLRNGSKMIRAKCRSESTSMAKSIINKNYFAPNAKEADRDELAWSADVCRTLLDGSRCVLPELSRYCGAHSSQLLANLTVAFVRSSVFTVSKQIAKVEECVNLIDVLTDMNDQTLFRSHHHGNRTIPLFYRLFKKSVYYGAPREVAPPKLKEETVNTTTTSRSLHFTTDIRTLIVGLAFSVALSVHLF